MYVKCQSLSIKMEIKVRTVKISTASGLFQYCSRTAFQCQVTVSGYSIGIQGQYTVQDACGCYLTLFHCPLKLSVNILFSVFSSLSHVFCWVKNKLCSNSFGFIKMYRSLHWNILCKPIYRPIYSFYRFFFELERDSNFSVPLKT